MRIPDFYQRTASGYDRPINHKFYQDIGAALLGMIPSGKPIQTILEVGAGTGFTTALLERRFPEAQIIALEPSEAMLKCGRQRVPGARWRLARLGQLRSGCFDLVVASMSYHWLDPTERDRLAAAACGGTLAVAASVIDHPRNAPVDLVPGGNSALRNLLCEIRAAPLWSRADRRADSLTKELGRSFNRVRQAQLTLTETFPAGRDFSEALYTRGTLLALFSNKAPEARDRLINACGTCEPVTFNWHIALITANSRIP